MICDKPTSVTVSTQNKNCIYETVKRIDQIQKEVLLENNCVGCEGSLFSRLYNTKPVSFILCSGERFTAELEAGATPVTTTYFRIQEIKGNCVILQLIDFSGETPVCATNTVVFDLECACGIQCYAPITCTLCNECGN